MMPLPSVMRSLDGGTVFTLELSPDAPAFQGHFPGDPVLPGVIQVDWAMRMGEQVFGPLGAFAGLDQVKFLEAIRPGNEVELRLDLDQTGSQPRLRFEYRGRTGRKSAGVVLFQPRS